VQLVIPEPFLTKYFELFNVNGCPVFKAAFNVLSLEPNSCCASTDT